MCNEWRMNGSPAVELYTVGAPVLLCGFSSTTVHQQHTPLCTGPGVKIVSWMIACDKVIDSFLQTGVFPGIRQGLVLGLEKKLFSSVLCVHAGCLSAIFGGLITLASILGTSGACSPWGLSQPRCCFLNYVLPGGANQSVPGAHVPDLWKASGMAG